MRSGKNTTTPEHGKKTKKILRRNTKEATNEEHDWEKGEVIERLMWAK